MATGPLQLLILISLLAATASARPCKTIFYFSSTTTYYPFHSHPGNPNFPNSIQTQDPRHLTLSFTTAPRFRETYPSFNFNPYPASDDDLQASSSRMTSSDFPLKYLPSIPNSVSDRTKDIMGVVGALLFGVGCGALTAAIMYFVWALFSPQSFDFDDPPSSSDDDVTATKKKFAYVAIPVNPKVVDDDDLKMPAPPAKDVV